MKMVSMTGEVKRIAHTSGHVFMVGREPVEIPEDVPGLVEAALEQRCLPHAELMAAVKTYSEKTESAPMITDDVKKLAEDNGIDVYSLTGTGKDGRILKGDVTAAIEAKKKASTAAPETAQGSDTAPGSEAAQE